MKQATAFQLRNFPGDAIATSRRLLCMLMAALCFTLVQSFTVQAQTSAPTPLPRAAQDTLDKGIIAAKVPDYLLAIRYFEEARKLAPQAPVVFLNMGLAESRIPGRELRAMAWFGTYLAAYPDAPNTAAVKEQIGVLRVKNQSNVLRLIKAVQDATNQLSPPAYKKEQALRDNVVKLWAKAGDIQAALSISDLLEDEDDKSYARHVVSKIQAEDGDIAGAHKTVDLISGGENKSNAQKDIAIAQAVSGDIAGAQKTLVAALKTAELIQSKGVKDRAQSAIARAQAEVGISNAQNATRQSTSGTQRPTRPVIPVSKWLLELGTDDKGNMYSNQYLNSAPFLDLAGHLKSLNTSLGSSIARDNLQLEIFRKSEAQLLFDGLRETAKTMVDAQNVITEMLKQQAKR